MGEIRDVIKLGEGSASGAYGATGKVALALKGLCDILRHDVRDMHGETPETRGLYEDSTP